MTSESATMAPVTRPSTLRMGAAETVRCRTSRPRPGDARRGVGVIRDVGGGHLGAVERLEEQRREGLDGAALEEGAAHPRGVVARGDAARGAVHDLHVAARADAHDAHGRRGDHGAEELVGAAGLALGVPALGDVLHDDEAGVDAVEGDVVGAHLGHGGAAVAAADLDRARGAAARGRGDPGSEAVLLEREVGEERARNSSTE